MPDSSWHAYLVNLLTDERGINLRNGIAHRLKEQTVRFTSAPREKGSPASVRQRVDIAARSVRRSGGRIGPRY
jgi:hypothetical protein